MKRNRAMALVVCALLLFGACGKPKEPTMELREAEQLGILTYRIPKDWYFEDMESDIYFSREYSGSGSKFMAMMYMTFGDVDFSQNEQGVREALEVFVDIFLTDMEGEGLLKEWCTVDGNTAVRLDFKYKQEGMQVWGKLAATYVDNCAYMFCIADTEPLSEGYLAQFDLVLETFAFTPLNRGDNGYTEEGGNPQLSARFMPVITFV